VDGGSERSGEPLGAPVGRVAGRAVGFERRHRQFRRVGEEDEKKNHHMAKKKMELKVEVKRLEKTERLVEDADVVLDVGEDAAGLTGVVSASNLAIYDDDDDGDENDFFLDLGLDGDDDEVPPRVPRLACVV